MHTYKLQFAMSNRRKPSEIRLSQDSIKNHWKDNSCQIGETLDQLLKGEIKLHDIPKIIVKERNGNLFSADKRRLWVFKKLKELGNCETIAVKNGCINPTKFNTNNLGTSVRIRGSGDPGGSVWKILEKETVCSTFTAKEDDTAIDNNSGFDASRSPNTDEWIVP